jgi:hypothetical protein
MDWAVGSVVGKRVGPADGTAEGRVDGMADGVPSAVGDADGIILGVADGTREGSSLGTGAGCGTGCGAGTGNGTGTGWGTGSWEKRTERPPDPNAKDVETGAQPLACSDRGKLGVPENALIVFETSASDPKLTRPLSDRQKEGSEADAMNPEKAVDRLTAEACMVLWCSFDCGSGSLDSPEPENDGRYKLAPDSTMMLNPGTLVGCDSGGSGADAAVSENDTADIAIELKLSRGALPDRESAGSGMDRPAENGGGGGRLTPDSMMTLNSGTLIGWESGGSGTETADMAKELNAGRNMLVD